MISPVTNEEKQKLLESLTIKDKIQTLENILSRDMILLCTFVGIQMFIYLNRIRMASMRIYMRQSIIIWIIS